MISIKKIPKFIKIIAVIIIVAGILASAYPASVLYIKNMGISIKPSEAISPYDVEFFLQYDKRWGNEYLSPSNYKLAQRGCLLSIIASSCDYLGFDTNPKDLNKLFVENNVYTAGGEVIWYKINETIPSITYEYSRIFNSKTIMTDLKEGYLPIVLVKYHKTGYNHWVLIIGSTRDDFLIVDPLDMNKKPMPLKTHGKVYSYRVLKDVESADANSTSNAETITKNTTTEHTGKDAVKNTQSKITATNNQIRTLKVVNKRLNLDERLFHGDLDDFDIEDYFYLRNAILAKHGYIFKSEKYKELFSKISWYELKNNTVDDFITESDKSNVELIDIRISMYFHSEEIEAIKSKIAKAKVPVDYKKLNLIITNKQEEGKSKDETLEYLIDNPEKFILKNVVFAIDSGDIDSDDINELLMVYKYLYNEDNTTNIIVLKWEGSSLNELTSSGLQFAQYEYIKIIDLIKGGNKEIFVMEDEFGYEYPEYQLLSYENGEIRNVDVDSFDLPSYGQFIEFNDKGTISVGYRVTRGLRAYKTYKWNGSKFEIVGSYSYDNRKLYKLDSKPQKTFDKEAPKLVNNEVEVSNVYEFVSVIGPNRTIKLQPGVYDLDYLKEETNNDYVKWMQNEDIHYGDLCIMNVENLTIEGIGINEVEIVSRKAETNVLTFEDCNNIQINNIIIGHGLREDGYGGPNNMFVTTPILEFKDCTSIYINNCDIYAGGTYALVASRLNIAEIKNTTFQQCRKGAFHIMDSSEISLNDCEISSNEGDELMVLDSANVFISDSKISNNYCTEFIKESNSNIDIQNITFENNDFDPVDTMKYKD